MRRHCARSPSLGRLAPDWGVPSAALACEPVRARACAVRGCFRRLFLVAVFTLLVGVAAFVVWQVFSPDRGAHRVGVLAEGMAIRESVRERVELIDEIGAAHGFEVVVIDGLGDYREELLRTLEALVVLEDGRSAVEFDLAAHDAGRRYRLAGGPLLSVEPGPADAQFKAHVKGWLLHTLAEGLPLDYSRAWPPGHQFERRLIARGFEQAVDLVVSPIGRVYVVERAGRILAIDDDAFAAAPVVAFPEAVQARLHGAFFAPDYVSTGHFYLWYTRNGARGKGREHRLSRFRFMEDKLDFRSEHVLLESPASVEDGAVIRADGAAHLQAGGIHHVVRPLPGGEIERKASMRFRARAYTHAGEPGGAGLPAFFDGALLGVQDGDVIAAWPQGQSGEALIAGQPFADAMGVELAPDGTLWVLERAGGVGQVVNVRFDANAAQGAGVSVRPNGGALPLTVTLHADGVRGALAWYRWSGGIRTKLGDGATLPWTVEEPGRHEVQLAVTRSNGSLRTYNGVVLAGNAPPTVRFDVGGRNSTFFARPAEADLAVLVDDPEDGSSAAGQIDAERIQVTRTVDGLVRLEAVYTDSGAPGAQALTGRAVQILREPRTRAVHWRPGHGVTHLPLPHLPGGGADEGAGPGPDEELLIYQARVGDAATARLPAVDLRGVHSVRVHHLAPKPLFEGGIFSLRLDAPDGRVVAEVEIPAGPTSIPNPLPTLDLRLSVGPGVHDLYLVGEPATSTRGLGYLFAIGDVEFLL